MRRKKHILSAVIACYQDALAIPIMYQRLIKVFKLLDVQYEIIFINDGSLDASETVLSLLIETDPHVIAVHHSRNFGSQMAFTSGMEIASGDAVILLDGDLQDPPEVIPQLYHQWLKGYAVVYGIRTDRRGPTTIKPFYKLFYRLFKLVSYVNIPLDSGDFSLIDRTVVDVLKKLPERDRFLRGLRAWVGYRQTGVEYVRPDRMFGRSTNNWIKNFHWATKGIFSFSYVPLQLMTLGSLATFLLALIGIIIQVILRIVLPDAPAGISTVIIVVLFLGSIQLLGLSIIGEYITKIFEETKQRPPYIVKNIERAS
jgi:dolichol-phosphate mannosyltransferase